MPNTTVFSKPVSTEIEQNAQSLAKAESGLAIIVDGDTAEYAVPVDAYAYIKNNTHGLADGLYYNKSSSAFPASGGTADNLVFASVDKGGLNALNDNLTNLTDNKLSKPSQYGNAVTGDGTEKTMYYPQDISFIVSINDCIPATILLTPNPSGNIWFKLHDGAEFNIYFNGIGQCAGIIPTGKTLRMYSLS